MENMEKKFSIVVNYVGNGYSVVLQSFIINDEGQRETVDSLIKSGLSLEESIEEIQKFTK